MPGLIVGNRDRCGRCGTIHGGNNHPCPVHGPVSHGCCETRCDPQEWELQEAPNSPVAGLPQYRWVRKEPATP